MKIRILGRDKVIVILSIFSIVILNYFGIRVLFFTSYSYSDTDYCRCDVTLCDGSPKFQNALTGWRSIFGTTKCRTIDISKFRILK